MNFTLLNPVVNYECPSHSTSQQHLTQHKHYFSLGSHDTDSRSFLSTSLPAPSPASLLDSLPDLQILECSKTQTSPLFIVSIDNFV